MLVASCIWMTSHCRPISRTTSMPSYTLRTYEARARISAPPSPPSAASASSMAAQLLLLLPRCASL